MLPEAAHGWDFVLNARQGAASASFEELADEVKGGIESFVRAGGTRNGAEKRAAQGPQPGGWRYGGARGGLADQVDLSEALVAGATRVPVPAKLFGVYSAGD